MKKALILPMLGVISASAFAQSPLTEAQMMQYTSKASKAMIGEKAELNLNLIGDGAGSIINGGMISQTVTHPNASYMKLHFKNIQLAGGGKLIVRAQNNSEVYVYTEDNMRAATIDPSIGDDGIAQFSSMSVSADTVIVEYTPGINANSGNGAVEAPVIDFYHHGNENDMIYQAEGVADTASTCGAMERRDVQCWANTNPTEFERTRPVARLLMNGRGLCTGWRVGSDNKMFTNNHCVESASELATTEVWFNYQNKTCDGSTKETVVKVTGQNFLKTDYTLDYTLFSVNDFSKVAPFGYFGLDVRDATQGERIYIPQHGAGNPKELSIESDRDSSGLCSVNQANANGRGTGTDIGYYCDTIGGSSGSPVLAASTHNVIALHHLGGCTNKGAKISLIWPQVASHFNNVVPVGDNGPIDIPVIANYSFQCQDLTCDFDASTSSSSKGAITEYRWDFGDQSGPKFGKNVQHAFASSGTYSVKLTVTNSNNDSKAATRSVVVEKADENGKLTNGQPKSNLSGARGADQLFYIDVPAGTGNVSFKISGGSGDADLYVRKDAKPTTSTWDCRPYRYGNNESCSATGGGRYWIMLRGYTAYSGVTLTASH